MKKTSPKNKNGKFKIDILPKSMLSAAAFLVLLFVEALFLLILEILDILPGKYTAAIVLLIILIDTGVLFLFNCRKSSDSKSMIGLIITIAVMIVINFGSFCLYNTYETFSKISEELVQTESFYVVAAKNSGCNDAEDIKGKTVGVTEAETRTYKEAKGKLVTKCDVKYDTERDLITLGHRIVDEKGKKHDNIIFVSKNSYDMICENIDSFSKKTKVIYKVRVEVKSNNNSRKINVTEDSFNVYITGIDVFGDIDQVSRSDVNMIMTVNPKTKEILLTSIPRDMYVTLHSFGALDKLTHSGIYGVDETINTVEDWMDIDINYYVRLNFSMLVRIVDAIGGVDVKSEYSFKSAVSDYTYEKGMNHLNGKAALYFARERKAFKAEDAQRIKNQQIVLKAIINKVTGSPVLLTNYTQLLNAVEGTMQTDLSNKDISALVKMQLNDLGKWKITTISVKGTKAYEYTYSMGMKELYVSIPVEKTVKRAKEKVNSVMYPVEDSK